MNQVQPGEDSPTLSTSNARTVAAPRPLPQIGSSTNVLGSFGGNLLCVWNRLPAVGPSKEGTNQILVGEIGFYDLARPDRVPQRAPGGFFGTALAVSPDGGLVSASTLGGQIPLLDPAMRKLIESLHGHLITAIVSAFSPDGQRLFSPYGGQEAVKLREVSTRRELLTLAGIDSNPGLARWSAGGDVISGPPWQAWSAPSWEEIAATEAKEKTESKKP